MTAHCDLIVPKMYIYAHFAISQPCTSVKIGIFLLHLADGGDQGRTNGVRAGYKHKQRGIQLFRLG